MSFFARGGLWTAQERPVFNADPRDHLEIVAQRPHHGTFALGKIRPARDGIERIAVARDHAVRTGPGGRDEELAQWSIAVGLLRMGRTAPRGSRLLRAPEGERGSLHGPAAR